MCAFRARALRVSVGGVCVSQRKEKLMSHNYFRIAYYRHPKNRTETGGKYICCLLLPARIVVWCGVRSFFLY